MWLKRFIWRETGILIGISQMVISYFFAKKEGVEKENGRFTWKELWRTFKGSWVFWLRSSSVSGLLRRLSACAFMWHVI
jgi:TRAP-type C4-dicarboxylate transport system permease large subunit